MLHGLKYPLWVEWKWIWYEFFWTITSKHISFHSKSRSPFTGSWGSPMFKQSVHSFHKGDVDSGVFHYPNQTGGSFSNMSQLLPQINCTGDGLIFLLLCNQFSVTGSNLVSFRPVRSSEAPCGAEAELHLVSAVQARVHSQTLSLSCCTLVSVPDQSKCSASSLHWLHAWDV